MSCCSHCGKQRAALKRCARCKQASYCGAECQNAAWKGHKKMCVDIGDVHERVNAAAAANDWRELLKWEGRMEEMMDYQDGACCDSVLDLFATAHKAGMLSTGRTEAGRTENKLSIVSLQERRVEILGKMQRFRDQGEALCTIADALVSLKRQHEAAGYFQRIRKLGEAHGFFSLECNSCLGLGQLAMEEGRAEEGVELMRNALVAAPLIEGNDSILIANIQLHVLHYFTEALFQTHAIDEVEPLVPRYREAAKAESDKAGRLSYYDLHSLYTSALLHEARGRPQEAGGEVRALLDLMHENESRVLEMLKCHELLREASARLEILDPACGDEELIHAVAAELAKHVAWMAGSSELQQGPGGA